MQAEDAIEALSPEREALWARLEKATFLTADEKRSAVGYGPLENDESKFNPNHDHLGRFTTGDGSERPQPASRTPRSPPRGGPRRDLPAPRDPTAPRSGTGLPPARPFEGREAIDLYRSIHNMPPEQGTVAYTEVDGAPFLGVNSRAPGYTDADRAAANEMRDSLLARYPDVMSTGNIGWMPNDALYHAEATTLLRVARANGGSLAGRTITIHVDRDMCSSCRAILPFIGSELGNPRVTFVETTGATKTMQHGDWIR